MKAFCNIANFTSLLRIVLAIPLWQSLSVIDSNSGIDSIYYFLFLCFLISVTDVLDGYFARYFNTVTDTGA